jgi:hypothetical protein
MAPASDRSARRSELLGLIAELAPDRDGDVTDETPLISSGLVESLALLTLVLWVEAQVSPAVDLSAFDLAAEWETPRAILDFVERHAAGPGDHAAPRPG